MVRAQTWLSFLMASAMAITISAPAQADVPSPSFYPGISGGGNLVLDDWDFNEVGEDGAEVSPSSSPALKLRVGFQLAPRLAIELGGGWLPFKAGDDTRNLGLSAEVDAIFHLMKGNFSPFIDVGAGGYFNQTGDVANDVDPQFHWGLGVRGMATKRIAVRLEARHVMSDRLPTSKLPFSSNLEVTAGLDFFFGGAGKKPTDRDRDGVVDSEDKCPDVVGTAAHNGCPDTDKDGIGDDVDKCVSEAETVNGYQDTDGCPDEIPDTDGDGMKDNVDKCPTEAEDVDTFQDDDGCPDADNDADGVADRKDNCPMVAGPKANRGCPDADKDGDGIVDRLDNCPNQPGKPEKNGCAEAQLVKISGEKIEILDRVYFDTAKATILPKSFPLLNNVARVLKTHPNIAHLHIEGHTDSEGDDAANKKLSQERADAVRAYLLKQGIAPERLDAIGFGEEQPIESNDTPKGRAANRRVEFKIMDE